MLIYCYAGDKANDYLKYHILGRRAEIYSDTGNYLLSRAIWGALLGWATIPLALLHNIFFNKSG
ncbi:hypothetical protein IKH79_00510 [Candidatus Saccharibacteria bacterium]|nr:hypothetical protein [Candidatus Saccharibacteria bacterium]